MFQYSMLHSPLTSGVRSDARNLALLCGLVATIVAGLFAFSATRAHAASSKRIELGGKNMTLKPNCGRDFTRDCLVEGKITAFQSLSGLTPGRNFVVPYTGKLVAWSISLANVTRRDLEVDGQTQSAQLPAFNDVFGSPSQAGISILRQVEKKKKGGPRYKLVRRSPVQILNPYFGTKVTFALDTPLNVFKDNIVALTIPTWAPALWRPNSCRQIGGQFVDPAACSKFTWRGSRVERGEPEPTCNLGRDVNTGEPNEQLAKTAPQTRLDSIRRYGCYYGGNVLLYSATIVAKPDPN